MRDLRTLRTQNGAPSYATLSSRTGLPRSTVYDALRRDRLPALATTLALVEALGSDPIVWRRRWTMIRAAVDRASQRSEPSNRRGPVGAAAEVGVPVEPSGRTDSNGPGPAGRRLRRRWVLAGGIAVLLIAGASATYLVWPTGSDCQHAQLYTVTSAGDLLDGSGRTVGRTEPGDTILVRSHKHDAFAHRLQGTVERSGDVGYVDEARIDPARTVCV